MKCMDLQEMLSAYADGELARTQRDFVEEHLASCADCRSTLAELGKVGAQFLSLRAIPKTPDVIEAVSARMSVLAGGGWRHRWSRSLAIAVPATAVTVALLSVYLFGFLTRPDDVIAKAYVATQALKSFRLTDYASGIWPGTTQWVSTYFTEAEYADTDHYRLKVAVPESVLPGQATEIIVYGDRVYSSTAPDDSRGLRQGLVDYAVKGFYDPQVPSKESTLALLTSLINLKKMPDETIDGVSTVHYHGQRDMEKVLADSINRVGQRYDAAQRADPSFARNVVKPLEDLWRSKEIDVEVWIDKDDNVLRQTTYTTRPARSQRNVGGPTLVETIAYYDFNQPITIEPPLSASDNLLPGWYVDYGRK